MKKDRYYLIGKYNATSTNDGGDDIETYDTWLERQLISRIDAMELLEKENATLRSINSDLNTLKGLNNMKITELESELKPVKVATVVVKEEIKTRKYLPFSSWIISRHQTSPSSGAGLDYMRLSEQSKKIIDMAVERYVAVTSFQRTRVSMTKNVKQEEE